MTPDANRPRVQLVSKGPSCLRSASSSAALFITSISFFKSKYFKVMLSTSKPLPLHPKYRFRAPRVIAENDESRQGDE